MLNIFNNKSKSKKSLKPNKAKIPTEQKLPSKNSYSFSAAVKGQEISDKTQHSAPLKSQIDSNHSKTNSMRNAYSTAILPSVVPSVTTPIILSSSHMQSGIIPSTIPVNTTINNSSVGPMILLQFAKTTANNCITTESTPNTAFSLMSQTLSVSSVDKSITSSESTRTVSPQSKYHFGIE